MLTDGARNAAELNTTSFGRLAAARFGLNRSINIKCKNMKSYDLAFAVDRT